MSKPRKPRPMPKRDRDRVGPVRAAEVMSLGYPDELNALRRQLEEPFDPTQPDTVLAIPDEYQIELLSRGQERALAKTTGKTPEQIERDRRRLEAYRERKERRKEWARTQWMRVRVWGARRSPDGEWSYSESRCRQWHVDTTGGGEPATAA